MEVIMSKKMTWDEFIEKYNKPNIILTDKAKEMFNGSHSLIECECNKHGKIISTPKRLLEAMFGCNECAKEYRNKITAKDQEQFIQDSRDIFGELYKYDKVHYINANTKVIMTCKIHGDFSIKPKDHLNNREGCPICKMSKLELALLNELKKNDIEFTRNIKIKGLNGKEIDFYLPKYNLGIECQGKQHLGLGGWSERFDFNEQYKRDKEKYELCEKSGVKLMYFIDKKHKSNVDKLDFYNDKYYFYELDKLIKYIKGE